MATTTVRLHPRYGDESPADASKLGGKFLWPSDEPWPFCAAHRIPLVTVLQLRASDFPEMSFRSGADLFQMLWCPREHDHVAECREMPSPVYWADPRFYWRSRHEMASAQPDNPPPQDAYYEYVPLPCRLLPERVTEYPSVYDLPEALAQRIHDWEDQNLGPDGTHAYEYEGQLSVAPGTKIGGYPQWIQFPWAPTCECGRAMDHLLTIATTEWDGIVDSRWTPVEEQRVLAALPRRWADMDENQRAVSAALWRPTGLSLGDGGHMQLFACHRCNERPVVAHIESC